MSDHIDVESLTPKTVVKRTAEVWYSPAANRRYFDRQCAIRAEVRGLLNKKYPSEPTEHDDSGRLTYPGWSWHIRPDAEKLRRRVERLVRRAMSNE